MENVPGMATGMHTQLLMELVDRFEKAGYQVAFPYSIRNAAHHGVPQDRRRLILLGARLGERLPTYPSATTSLRKKAKQRAIREHAPWFGPLPECPSVGDAIGDLPDIEDFPGLLATDELPLRLEGGSHYARLLRGEESDLEDYSFPRISNRDCLTGCLRAEHTELSRRRFMITEPGSTEPISRFYRLALDGVCNTLRAGTASDRGAFTSPRPIHPIYARCISVREAARLHSYPDWFRFHRTIWHGFRQIGNSVPPFLARAVGRALLEALEFEPARPGEPVLVGPASLAKRPAVAGVVTGKGRGRAHGLRSAGRRVRPRPAAREWRRRCARASRCT